MKDLSGEELVRTGFAVIQDSIGRYLVVKERKNKGWMIPGGTIEPYESLEEGVVREVLEETGVSVVLTGLLCVERIEGERRKRRFTFFGRPLGQDGVVKSWPDEHSEEARWLSFQEAVEIGRHKGKDPIGSQGREGGWRRASAFSLIAFIEGGGRPRDLKALPRDRALI